MGRELGPAGGELSIAHVQSKYGVVRSSTADYTDILKGCSKLKLWQRSFVI
jgi:hypothetical protein